MVLQFMSENTETYVVGNIREIKIHVYRKRQTSDGGTQRQFSEKSVRKTIWDLEFSAHLF